MAVARHASEQEALAIHVAPQAVGAAKLRFHGY